MDFVTLRDEAAALAELWGYGQTAFKPDWHTLVNDAYKYLVWITDAVKGPTYTFDTVIGQAEYTLTETVSGNTRDWKAILDCSYDGINIYPTDEAVIRRDDPLWYTRSSGQPTVRWMPRNNVLRLHPTPDAVATVTIYGIQAPEPLSLNADTPVGIPEVYHDAISVYAAYLHVRRYAKGEARSILADHLKDFDDMAASIKTQLAQQSATDGTRIVRPVEPERIYL